MTTKQLELRTEIIRKRIVLDRIELPGERRVARIVKALLIIGALAAVAIGFAFVGAR